MRPSLSLQHSKTKNPSDSSDYESDNLVIAQPQNLYYMNGGASNVLAGNSNFQPVAVTDDKLYCVCQSPHDDVSEMIGCDAPVCRIEWFHFECVGIMVPPEGQWYCPECTKRYNIRTNY